MSAQAQQPVVTNYRVEVSGWDSTESFFLENTLLYWNGTAQELSLRCHLREGTVVFVRLLQPFGSDENFPVPYVVAKNLPLEIDQRFSVSITRLHPKPTYRPGPVVSLWYEFRRGLAAPENGFRFVFSSHQFHFDTPNSRPAPF
jgi:hypothetical protein